MEMLIIQQTMMTARILFKVTVLLCLSPSKRARSLSTLIVAVVNKDTPIRLEPTTAFTLTTVKQTDIR